MEIAARFKQTLYLSRVRVLLRSAGMRRVLAAIGTLRSLGSQFAHRQGIQEHVTVHLRGFTATFRTATLYEFDRVEALGSERKFLQRLLQEVQPGDAAYDIGANLGLYTVFLAKAVGENGCVVAFEPEQRSLHRCRENVKLNALENVQLFDRALSNEDTEANFVVYENPASGVHHICRAGDTDVHARLQPIRLTIGDQFISEYGLPIPNVLKIDVEGMEEEVLLGLTQTLRHSECRVVMCEVHFAILDQRGRWDAPARIVKFLDSCGFKKVEWLNSGHCLAVKPSARAARIQRSTNARSDGKQPWSHSRIQ